MIAECSLLEAEDELKYCIITLPGRFGHGEHLLGFYAENLDMPNTMYIGVTPKNFQWYPMPINSTNQEDAVNGLPIARKAIEKLIEIVMKQFSITKNQIILTGFSAGGVMAIEVASHSDQPYAAAISHCGAILETNNLIECKHPNTPIVLIHSRDDNCFDWYERYLPMKQALIEKNYPTYTLENNIGGHSISAQEINQVGKFLKQYLGMQTIEENLLIKACSPL